MPKISPPLFIFRNLARRKRSGVSPVIATTIILAITVALGLSLWGFANSAVGTATVQYSQAIDDYGEVVRNHRFIIANVDFNNPSANSVAFWVYNNGRMNATIGENHMILTCSGCIQPEPVPNGLTPDPFDPLDPNPFTLTPKTLKKFVFDSGTTLEPGKTYELTVVSDAGLAQTYVKKAE